MTNFKLNEKPQYISVFFGLYEDMKGNKKVTSLFFNSYEVAYYLNKKLKNKELSMFNLMPFYIEKSKEKKYVLKYLELNEDKKSEDSDEVITYKKLLILDLSPKNNPKDISEKIKKVEGTGNFTFHEFELNLVDYENEEVLNNMYKSEYFMKTEEADIFRLPIISARKLIKPEEDPSETLVYFFGQIEYVEKGSNQFTNIQFEITDLAPTYMEAAYLVQEKINKLSEKELINIKINICPVCDDDLFSQEYFLSFKKIIIEEKLANGNTYNDMIYDFYMALYKKIKNKKRFIEEENEFVDIENETLVDIIYLKSKKFVSNELLQKKIEKFIYSEKIDMLDDAIDIVEEDYEIFLEEMNEDSLEYEEVDNLYENKPLLKNINRIISKGHSQDWLESLHVLKLLYLSNEKFNVYLHDMEISCEGFEELFNYLEDAITEKRKEPFILILSKESPLSICDKKIMLLTSIYLDKYGYTELPVDIIAKIKSLMDSGDSENKYLTNEEFLKRIKVKLL